MKQLMALRQTIKTHFKNLEVRRNLIQLDMYITNSTNILTHPAYNIYSLHASNIGTVSHDLKRPCG